ncbi:hypothetical protein QA648_34490 (plasmid) [Rhizobium sp. CB3171]|uniref:hypothetical protein n=1 Tax=Rhizobium sp. CB3171 TaxID=3039157 RepID=UPI0024B0E1C0|nr:hypothetical protein [Rhizobium sp. CB3171]WFU07212.1 hypothetical protein QA648_34490 [Rhizobium sp. CB3171]
MEWWRTKLVRTAARAIAPSAKRIKINIELSGPFDWQSPATLVDDGLQGSDEKSGGIAEMDGAENPRAKGAEEPTSS